MKISTRLVFVLTMIIGLQCIGLSANAQGVRTVVSSDNHIPGGYGIRLDSGFDLDYLYVADSVTIIPSVGLHFGYNVTLDDPMVRHLVSIGTDLTLRTSLDLTLTRGRYDMNVVPWFGMTVGACWSVLDLKDTDEKSLSESDSAWAMCYGPIVGIDVIVAEKLILSAGVETLFFNIGSSGWSRIPLASFGIRSGMGYNVQF